MRMTLQELATTLGADIEGDPQLELRGLAPIESAGEGDLTFLANKKYEKYLAETRASAIILAPNIELPHDRLAAVRLEDPYVGFVKALRLFFPTQRYAGPGIHAQSVIDETAVIGDDVTIAAGAVIGAGVRIGRGPVIAEGGVIRDNAEIGEDSLLYPNVTVLDRSRIGSRVILHAGTTIGSDGFGFAPHEGRYEKIPQVGFVIIEDDVEIGANCAIDRGTLGPTIIRRGVKLDNLIQIAHNVEIGEDSVVAAQAGISGSTVIGRHVIIAGQAGLVGHIEIGANVTIGAQAGVSKTLTGDGKMFRGSPAREIREELRLEAAMRRLPELIKTVREQGSRIKELEQALQQEREN